MVTTISVLPPEVEAEIARMLAERAYGSATVNFADGEILSWEFRKTGRRKKA